MGMGWEDGFHEFHGDRSRSAQDPSRACPLYSLIYLFTCILYTLYNKLINNSKYLFEFMSCFNKLIEPEEGFMGTSKLKGVDQKHR